MYWGETVYNIRAAQELVSAVGIRLCLRQVKPRDCTSAFSQPRSFLWPFALMVNAQELTQASNARRSILKCCVVSVRPR